MIHFWQHLSWSQAMLVVLGLVILYLVICLILAQLIGFNDRPLPPRKRQANDCWNTEDMQRKRALRLAQLGDDYLLAKPIREPQRPPIKDTENVILFKRQAPWYGE